MKHPPPALSVLPALLALLAAGAAHGQSRVEIYGILDAGIVSDSNGLAVGHSNRVDSGNEAGTRFGFRGSENISDDLAANFKLETGFGMDNGVSTQGGVLFGRQASVGLAGGWGAVNAGRVNTPSFNAMIAIDPLVTGFYGLMNNVFGAGGMRVNNAVNYVTPTLRGVTGEAVYSAGESALDGRSNRQFAWGLGYKGGPWVLRLAQHSANDASGLVLAKNTLLGGVYDTGPVKLHAAYAVNHSNTTLDTRDAMLGFTLPLGNSRIKGSVIRKHDRRLDDADLRQVGVAYTYAYSRRTDLYLSYTRSDNDGHAKYNAADYGLTARVIQLGIRHNL